MKQSKQAKFFSVTINNPTDQDITNLKNILPPKLRYIKWSLEKAPSTGTPHVQAFVQTKAQERVTSMKKVYPTAHIEICKGSFAQNSNYVEKSESHVDGPYELGAKVVPRQRTDLMNVKEMVKSKSKIELVTDNPGVYARMHKSIDLMYETKYQNTIREPPEVFVLWGEPGVGKTRYVYDRYKQENIYKLVRSNCTDKIWFNGYDPDVHSILLIDDFYGWIKFNQLLQLLDRYPVKVETKGGMSNLLSSRIYITSNIHPDQWYTYSVCKRKAALMRRIKKIQKIEPPHEDHSTIFDYVDGNQ